MVFPKLARREEKTIMVMTDKNSNALSEAIGKLLAEGNGDFFAGGHQDSSCPGDGR